MKTNYGALAAVTQQIGRSKQTALRIGSLAQQLAQLFDEEELVWNALDGPSRALLTNFLHKIVNLETSARGVR